MNDIKAQIQHDFEAYASYAHPGLEPIGKLDENEMQMLIKHKSREFYGTEPDKKMIEMFLNGIESKFWLYSSFNNPEEMLIAVDIYNDIYDLQIDLNKITAGRELINEGLELLNFFRDGKWNTESIIHKGHPQLEAFGKWAEQNEQQIEQLLDIPTVGKHLLMWIILSDEWENTMPYPIIYINAVLKWVGLQLRVVDTMANDENNNQLNIYAIDSEMIELYANLPIGDPEMMYSADWVMENLTGFK